MEEQEALEKKGDWSGEDALEKILLSGDNEKIKAQYKKALGKYARSNYLFGMIHAIVFIVLIICIYLAFVVGGPANLVRAIKNLGGVKQTVQTISKAGMIREAIDTYSIYEADEADYEAGVYKGIVSALEDHYANYYTKEEYKEMMEADSGTFVGIGVLVSLDEEDRLEILEVYEGSSAKEAGLQVEDRIIAVGDQSIEGWTTDEAVAVIKGKEGSEVTLTILRGQEEFEISLKRKSVDVPSVKLEMKEGEIAYISISQFQENTDEQFSQALASAKEAGAKGLVFDVRNNPGGYYDTVCNMLDELLPEGVMVYTMDKNGKKVEEKSDANCINLPMVVITNGDSASASEVFTGALKDYELASVVCTTTFGKGIVQSVMPMEDGSAIKITTSKYYTPKGNNIHGKGIEPDVEVKKEEDQLDTALELMKEKIRGETTEN